MKDLTIGIPIYKRLDYLKMLVESIPDEYPVCISDNGYYVKDIFFSRSNVKICHLENVVPMFSNWNQVINMVKTKWFMLPGDDDVIYPDKLEFIMQQIERFPDCAFLAFGYDIINDKNEKRKGWVANETRRYERIEAFLHIQRTIPYRSPSIVINTEKSRGIGNYCEEFAYTASDSLFLQNLALKYPIVEVNEVVAGYRMWSNNFTSLKNSTPEWFDQLNLWIQKLSELLREEKWVNIDLKKLHDLIIYDNLRSAFNNIVDVKSKFNLLSSVGWPKRIGVANHLKIIKSIIN